jgi:mono/diheme cytochrome c family protein
MVVVLNRADSLVVFSAVVSALVLAIGAAPREASAAPAAQSVEKGQQVYAAQKCQMCHSIGGKGNAKGPLDGVGSKLSAEDIHQWMVDAEGMTAKTKAPRKPVMKSYPKLSKEDLADLVAYMQSLKK